MKKIYTAVCLIVCAIATPPIVYMVAMYIFDFYQWEAVKFLGLTNDGNTNDAQAFGIICSFMLLIIGLFSLLVWLNDGDEDEEDDD